MMCPGLQSTAVSRTRAAGGQNLGMGRATVDSHSSPTAHCVISKQLSNIGQREMMIWSGTHLTSRFKLDEARQDGTAPPLNIKPTVTRAAGVSEAWLWVARGRGDPVRWDRWSMAEGGCGRVESGCECDDQLLFLTSGEQGTRWKHGRRCGRTGRPRAKWTLEATACSCASTMRADGDGGG